MEKVTGKNYDAFLKATNEAKLKYKELDTQAERLEKITKGELDVDSVKDEIEKFGKILREYKTTLYNELHIVEAGDVSIYDDLLKTNFVAQISLVETEIVKVNQAISELEEEE